MKRNVVKEKSFAFALRMVKLARWLEKEQREFVLSRQVLRSGTAIGASIREAEHGQSKADFTSKMSGSSEIPRLRFESKRGIQPLER